MEIGSFIELQFATGQEYYPGHRGIARLNSGRAAIWHAMRVLECSTIWLPYYQCDSVRTFLKRKGATVRFYSIDRGFDPINLHPGTNEAVLLVNYFGIMSPQRMACLAEPYSRVIIDNAQAFFCRPIGGCMTVYSCRKFIGAPDGAYVIGEGAERYADRYPQGVSSDTSLFLLERIEYGCAGKAYEHKVQNDQRISAEDILHMSRLTHSILDAADYEGIIGKRRENFQIAEELFHSRNCLDPCMYMDESCVPMVYPLAVEDDTLVDRLQQAGHYQGHLWSYLLEERQPPDFEYWISKYVIPITIDQRYARAELEYLREVIK